MSHSVFTNRWGQLFSPITRGGMSFRAPYDVDTGAFPLNVNLKIITSVIVYWYFLTFVPLIGSINHFIFANNLFSADPK